MELKGNNGGDLPNLLLNLEKLVHGAHLQLLGFALELVHVEKALKQYEWLGCAFFSNGLLDQSHHEVIVVVHCGVLLFFKLVLDSFSLDFVSKKVFFVF